MKLPVRIPRLAATIQGLLLTFLVLFPKGGFRVANTPITWGYLLLGFLFVPLLAVRLLFAPFRESRLALIAVASVIPFQLVFCYSWLANGVNNLGYGVAIIMAFFFLPAMFLLVFPPFLSFLNPIRFQRQLCFCILAAALWGIFLFFYHPIMGKYIEIPYLTVNAGDYGLLETYKHIARGGFLKLIATYNNGNLYGVATIILLPLYLKFEPARWKRNVIRVALVLTLSRTVWFGLIMDQVLTLAAKVPEMVARFPRIYPGKATRQLLAVIATVVLVLFGLVFNGNGLGFLLDSGLSGRGGELASFLHPTLLPSQPVDAFAELLYASALGIYGIVGFVSIMLIFATPVFILSRKAAILASPSRRAAAKGLILYAIVASIDGATILIPVMAFYWFAYMTMIYGLPGELPAESPPAPVSYAKLIPSPITPSALNTVQETEPC
jgi:hypothetical protein